MVYKEHLIEIYVNGQKLELENQKSINIRFNNVLLNPTKITSTQAEYSFEFEVPATPRNNTIFDYANNLSKLNKFHQRYNADVYADGSPIFSGTLVVNNYNEKQYSLNLVSIKSFSWSDIFGDMTMSDIKWKIPFNGAGNSTYSMDYYNALPDSKVCFPLTSYGAFAKRPYHTDTISNDYTSKFDLDKWNDWYVESFYPSPNVMETLKKAFESVVDDNGNQKFIVGGNIFTDNNLNDIFMSTNLADEQSPNYNVGNPRFGTVDLSVNLTTNVWQGYEQELNFPYFKVKSIGYNSEQGITSEEQYNFSSIVIHDLLEEGTVNVFQQPSYMYQPNENCIVIPADGFYKIYMSVSSSLATTGTIKAKQYTVDTIEREMNEEELELNVGFYETTPIEIQLVRNYDDNIELIKGKHNRQYYDGNPNHDRYAPWGRPNITDWVTCFPHEDLYSSTLPTELNDLKLYNTTSRFGGRRHGTFGNGSTMGNNSSTSGSGNSDTSESGNFSGRRGGTRGDGGRNGFNSERNYSALNYGYVYDGNGIMCYDPVVSEAFICGFSTMSSGVTAVMKNGKSWSEISSVNNGAFYKQNGYLSHTREAGTGNDLYTQTSKNRNSYFNAPTSTVSCTNNSINGNLYCLVYLNKNDILSLKEIHRGYVDQGDYPVRYSTTTNVTLKIEAYSPNKYYTLEATRKNDYSATTQFDTDLNIGNFLNKDKKVSDWVQNIMDAFNLEVTQFSNVISINTKNKLANTVWGAVDIDDRVNVNEVKTEMIDYPRSMSVKYKVDTDEWGAERSAVETYGSEDVMNREDWKKFIDSGYTSIILNDDTYVTTTSDKNLQFSYSWYDTFHWYNVNQDGTQTEDAAVDIKIPVISKYTYMIDGYDYEESRKHDGYGLNQRFWFRPTNSGCFVWTATYPKERVNIYTTSNTLRNINLSYKNTEKSILTEYFNINAFLASNYVELDVYLSADEYNRIKNGSLVHFDSDLYYPVEISGYDPSGSNPTTIKIMKKVS